MSLENKGDLACSFCRKGRRDVRKLIAGPDVYICDECVGLCLDIIEEEEIAGEERSPGVSVLSILDPAHSLLPRARRLVESCNRAVELPRPVAERARALAEEIALFASANAESRIVFAEYANSIAVTARHFAKACDALELPRRVAERARALEGEIEKLVTAQGH